MEEWLRHWDHMVSNLEEPLSEKTLRDIMVPHLKSSEVLKEDMAHFERVGKLGVDHNYQFLRSCIERYSSARHMKAVQDQRRAALSGNRTPALGEAPAMVATATENRRPRSNAPKGDAKSNQTGTAANGAEKLPCWFHNNAHYTGGQGCNRGKDCPRDHSRYVSKADFENMVRPGTRSQSQTPAQPKGDGKGAGKGNEHGRKPRLIYCRDYLLGKCNRANCKWPHWDQETVDAKEKEFAASQAGTKST